MKQKTYKSKQRGMGFYLVVALLISVIAVGTVSFVFIAAPNIAKGKDPLSASTYLMDWSSETGATPEQGVVSSSNSHGIEGPVTFYIDNARTGGLFSSYAGTVDVYNIGNYAGTVASIDIASGTGTSTGNQFTSGQKYMLHVYADTPGTYEDVWSQWVVPNVSSLTADTIKAPLGINLLPSPSVSVTDSNGKQYLNGADWNVSTTKAGATPGYAKGEFNIDVRNTLANSGFSGTSYDPINEVDYKAILVVTVSGTDALDVSIKGANYADTKGDVVYYVFELTPSMMAKSTVGSTSTGGIQSFTPTISVSGSTPSATITMQTYFFTSIDDFKTNNDSVGTEAVAMGSSVALSVVY